MTLEYDGVLTNSTGADLNLIGYSINPPDGIATPDYSLNFAPTFDNAVLYPGIIPTTGYSGPIFTVHLDPTADPATVLNGHLDIVTDVPGDPQDIDQPFSASIAQAVPPPVPEPPSLPLLGLGLSMLTLFGLSKPNLRNSKA